MNIKKWIQINDKYSANKYVTFLGKFWYTFHIFNLKWITYDFFSLNLNIFNFHKMETTFKTT